MIRKTPVEAAAIKFVAHLNASDPAKGLRDAIEARFPGALDKEKAVLRKVRFEAKFVGNVPDWAKRLVAKYTPSLRTLRWHRSAAQWSASGHCKPYASEIIVTTASPAQDPDESDAKYVLLHEIAHLRGGTHHDERFWDECYRLLVAENLYRKTIAHGRSIRSLKAAASRARARQKGAA